MHLGATRSPTIASYYKYFASYFFEWCVWIGYAVYSARVRARRRLDRARSPARDPRLDLEGHGHPATEKQALLSRGDAYRDYQKRVGAFVPLPPKRS